MQKLYLFVVFHVSIWGGLELCWGAKPTKAPHGDGTVWEVQRDSLYAYKNKVIAVAFVVLRSISYKCKWRSNRWPWTPMFDYIDSDCWIWWASFWHVKWSPLRGFSEFLYFATKRPVATPMFSAFQSWSLSLYNMSNFPQVRTNSHRTPLSCRMRWHRRYHRLTYA